MNKPGPKVDPRRYYYASKFKLSARWWNNVTSDKLDQIDRCKDDDARRLIIKEIGK